MRRESSMQTVRKGEAGVQSEMSRQCGEWRETETTLGPPPSPQRGGVLGSAAALGRASTHSRAER